MFDKGILYARFIIIKISKSIRKIVFGRLKYFTFVSVVDDIKAGKYFLLYKFW